MTLRKRITSKLFIRKPNTTLGEAVVSAETKSERVTESLWQAEAERNLEDEEELFNQEANVTKSTPYTWEDKHRPRKPKYFNRVHTGYEWNKYNQTHYE